MGDAEMKCTLCQKESDELTTIEIPLLSNLENCLELCNFCRSEILRQLMSQFILEMWMEKPDKEE